MAATTGRIQKKKREASIIDTDIIEGSSILESSRKDLISSLTIDTKSLKSDLPIKSVQNQPLPVSKSILSNKRQATEKLTKQTTKPAAIQTPSSLSPIVSESSSRLTPEPSTTAVTATANGNNSNSHSTTRIAKLSVSGRKRTVGSGNPEWVQPLQDAILRNEVCNCLNFI